MKNLPVVYKKLFRNMYEPKYINKPLQLKIKKYLDKNELASFEELTGELMKQRQYQNANKKHFLKQVSKVYQWELHIRNAKKDGPIEIVDEHSDDEVLEEDFFEIDRNGEQDIVELPMQKSSPSFSIDTLYRTPSSTPSNAVKTPLSSSRERMSSKIFKKTKRKEKESEVGDLDADPPTAKKKKTKFESLTPNSSLQEMEGIKALHEVACLLITNLIENNLKVDAPKSVLLAGPQGSGKTMFATCLAGDVNASLLRVPVSDLTGGIGVEKERLVKDAFSQALSLEPCVLLLENVDALSSKELGMSKGPDKRICDQIEAALIEFETVHCDKRVLVIAETRHPQTVDLNLRARLKTEVFMPVLDKDSRTALLKLLCPDAKPDFEFGEIGLRTSSFVAGDLKELVQKARHRAWKRVVVENLGKDAFSDLKKFVGNYMTFMKEKDLEIRLQDFIDALAMVTPTLKRQGFPSVPNTTWDDVGGLEDIKSELAEKILSPMQHGALHAKFGAKKPNGIMLWGPPGCGKTLVAKAVANHAGVNLYAVMGPELLNMYQGESERAIREVFKRAASVAPCVIFFDEFDCICPRRSSTGESGSKMTIVNTLLVEMNGFNQRKDVYVMAATNRPDMVDPAVLRPERFDTSLYVGLPDQKSRVAILNACTKNGQKPRLASDVDLTEISAWCDGFSGADCAQLVYMASKTAIAEELKWKVISGEGDGKKEEEEERGGVGTLAKRHFIAASKRVTASVGLEEQRKYLRMKSKLEHSRKAGKEVTLEEEVEEVAPSTGESNAPSK